LNGEEKIATEPLRKTARGAMASGIILIMVNLIVLFIILQISSLAGS
jgi:hypothetical protein